MPFKKGHKKTGGRAAGVENKTTKDIRKAYQMLIEDNIPNLKEWLNRIAKKNPAQAIMILSELSEYVLPKLSRTDITSDGKPLSAEIPTIVLKVKNDN